MDCSLNFRQNVRNLVLNKDIKIETDAKNMLLKYCDQFRDELRKESIEFKVSFCIAIRFLKIIQNVSNSKKRTTKKKLHGNISRIVINLFKKFKTFYLVY